MLSKRHKIPRHTFRKLPKHHRTVHGTWASLRATKIPEQSYRCAVVVAKKVLTKASDRSRLRRRVYALIQERRPHLHKGTALVFFMKKGAHTLSPTALRAEIQGLLRQVQ